MIGASGMGEREAQFYADVAPSVEGGAQTWPISIAPIL